MVDIPAVLIGEDHADTLAGFEEYFRSVGFDVDTAATGRLVLDKVSLHRPDVLLLDMELPDLDGWEVTRTLRRAPATARSFDRGDHGAHLARASPTGPHARRRWIRP
jgi:CheY-like chemotaxis protein